MEDFKNLMTSVFEGADGNMIKNMEKPFGNIPVHIYTSSAWATPDLPHNTSTENYAHPHYASANRRS